MELSRIATPKGIQTIDHPTDQIRPRLSSARTLVDATVGELAPNPMPHANATTEQQIRALLRLRRNRNRFFDADLFADPAWDILLELYAAELGQQRISISNLGQRSGVPATTALRWLCSMEKRRLIKRKQDPLDGRRYYMSLTSEGLESIENYFRTVPAGSILV